MSDEKPTGIAAAAVLSVAFGTLVLAVSHLLSVYSDSAKNWIHAWGRWMPGAERIGPYSGKETLALLAWLGSWALLHLALRRRNVSLTRTGLLFLVGIGAATTLLWPPVTEAMVHWMKGGP